jgi:hypothetical protein
MNHEQSAMQVVRRSFRLGSVLAMVGIAASVASPSAFAAYEVITVTNGGTIDGVVTLTGAKPAEPAITVTKNQDYCGSTIPNPTYVVDASGGLGDVIVYLKDITKGKAAPTEPVVLDNLHCMFAPRATGAMVGQKIKVTTGDPILHNTHLQDAATNATIFNVAMPFKGFSVTKPLPGSPEMINIKCDAHEWMHAWIMELDHPYFATTDAAGHFSFKDVPPGNYTLVAWHETAGEKSAPVVVAAGKATKSTITLAAK